jgi:cytidine deaminase
MDFRIKHKDSAETILKDLVESKNALDFLLKAGKAVELNYARLKHSSRMKIGEWRFRYVRIKQLVNAAREAREFSYAPYSHFNVGAAILAGDNKGERKIFEGCNVENAAYGSTICAERTAAFKAVSEGFRKFFAYAVVGGFDDSKSEEIKLAAQKEYVTPCGPCRQVTNEFEANPCLVIIAKDTGRIFVTTIQYLLPGGFGPRNLGVSAAAYDRHAEH